MSKRKSRNTETKPEEVVEEVAVETEEVETTEVPWKEGDFEATPEVKEPAPVEGDTKERGITAPIVHVEESPRAVEIKEEPVKQTRYFSSDAASMALADEQLSGYLTNMAPGKSISELEASREQVNLYNVFMTVLNQPGDEAVTALTELLEVVKSGLPTVFHAKYVLRAQHIIPLTTTQRKAFVVLVNLFITTCDPTTRKRNLKTVSLDYVGEAIANAKHQQVIEFFFNR